MPSADGNPTGSTELEDQEEEAVAEVDEARESLLEAVTTELGDAVVGSHLKPGTDLWVRVETEAWAETADYLRNRQRFRFFDWLSAVDWMPSPFGRSLEAEVDKQVGAAADEEAEADETGTYAEAVAASLAGGAARFQVFARVHSLATGIGINVKTDVDAQLSVATLSLIHI